MKQELVQGNLITLLVVLGLTICGLFIYLVGMSIDEQFRKAWWTLPAMVLIGIIMTNVGIYLDHYNDYDDEPWPSYSPSYEVEYE